MAMELGVEVTIDFGARGRGYHRFWRELLGNATAVLHKHSTLCKTVHFGMSYWVTQLQFCTRTQLPVKLRFDRCELWSKSVSYLALGGFPLVSLALRARDTKLGSPLWLGN